MTTRAIAEPNPLGRFAQSLPRFTGEALTAAGLLAASLLAAYIVYDQDYDPTQAFASVSGAIVLFTLVAGFGKKSDMVLAFGAGWALFAGALLTGQNAGIAMIVAGAVAGIGVAIRAYQAGRSPATAAIAFLVAAGPVALTVVSVVALFED